MSKNDEIEQVGNTECGDLNKSWWAGLFRGRRTGHISVYLFNCQMQKIHPAIVGECAATGMRSHNLCFCDFQLGRSQRRGNACSGAWGGVTHAPQICHMPHGSRQCTLLKFINSLKMRAPPTHLCRPRDKRGETPLPVTGWRFSSSSAARSQISVLRERQREV